MRFCTIALNSLGNLLVGSQDLCSGFDFNAAAISNAWRVSCLDTPRSDATLYPRGPHTASQDPMLWGMGP
jgi:hypothetical protein